MNKNEFLKIIKEGLNDFPPEQLEDVLYDYEQHFANAMADGKTEEEIIANLGDPFVIVNQYRNGYVQTVPEYESNNDSNATNNDNYSNNNFNNNDFTKQNPGGYNNNYNNGNFNGYNPNYRPPYNKSGSANKILKLAIIVLSLIIFGPFALAIGATVFAVAISAILVPIAIGASGIGLMLSKVGVHLLGFSAPAALADFPMSATILITIGSIAASILMLLIFIYLVKGLIRLIRKFINRPSKNGGAY